MPSHQREREDLDRDKRNYESRLSFCKALLFLAVGFLVLFKWEGLRGVFYGTGEN